jgi:mRNA guanylyltransferase
MRRGSSAFSVPLLLFLVCFLFSSRSAHRWKASKEQYDDRVVEVVWDKPRETWKMLRFRDDKFEGNYKTVVGSIIKSIQHGVEAEQVRLSSSFSSFPPFLPLSPSNLSTPFFWKQLVAHAGHIRHAWKRREAARRGGPPPPSSSSQQQRPSNGNGHAHHHQQQQQQQHAPPPPVNGSGGYGGGGGGGGGGLRR